MSDLTAVRPAVRVRDAVIAGFLVMPAICSRRGATDVRVALRTVLASLSGTGDPNTVDVRAGLPGWRAAKPKIQQLARQVPGSWVDFEGVRFELGWAGGRLCA